MITENVLKLFMLFFYVIIICHHWNFRSSCSINISYTCTWLCYIRALFITCSWCSILRSSKSYWLKYKKRKLEWETKSFWLIQLLVENMLMNWENYNWFTKAKIITHGQKVKGSDIWNTIIDISFKMYQHQYFSIKSSLHSSCICVSFSLNSKWGILIREWNILILSGEKDFEYGRMGTFA